ncbi:CARDB domain-containing protein, partial [Microcystis sp. LE19-195.1E]|uniref:CARDB domain-containing protein n=1 Tax=Microcystis sp. LE19-195.1E TaxID=3016440 RepID=UPI0022BAF39E
VTLPSNAVGSGYLLFKTDAYNYQTESNENDNVYTQAIDIAAPNLIITNVTAPTTASASQTITLSWTGKNDSSVTTGSSYWYDRVVFSKNQFFGDSDDVYLTDSYIYSYYGLPLEANETYTVNTSVTLPVQAVGSGYLLFRTDVYNYQVESNENDNVYTQAIDIAAPNLTITSATAPSTGILGGAISVSWTVLNNGTVPANADWYDSVYLSNDQTWDSGDTWITAFWEAARSPLAANTSYTDTQNITIPSNAGTGAKYLIFVTDQYSYYYYYNQQGETDETDNTYAVPITLGAPDLTISSATAPSSGVVNGAINVSWTVKNQGTTDAPADWYDLIYLSSDNIPGNGNDSYIAEQFISTQTPLIADGSYTINRSINLPNVTPGNYYIFFRADAYNYQGETNENNNYSQAIPITIGSPDLIVSNATAPESGALGGTVSLSWTVQNQGTVEAPADWTDYIYWSSNDTYDGSDTFITSISAAAQTPVAVGGSYSKTENITLPNQINFVGNGYLIVRADGNNAQGETDENNNDRAIPIRIDAPDLIVSNATAPASVTVGATISVTWDVKNQGTVAANADWYDRVVISTDQIFGNSDDTYLTEVWQGSFTPLAAGATYSRTLNVTLPSTATGDRYLLFKADNYNYQGETDENNNVYSLPINISASDLQVTATNAPTSAILGETVELTWTVTNNGTGAASQDWYDRVYLSSNQTLDSNDVQVTYELIATQTPLATGASYTISKNVTLPSFNPGNQYLLFVADSSNYQGEINENNNLAAVPITLTAPDLIVSNASVPATGTVGKSIEVSWTVQNQGTSAAPTDWYDRIYLSNDAIFDANADTYITQELISTQTPLAAGASYSITRNITIPNFGTGNRYLIFVADGSGGQGETNETNNTRAVAINLNAPDLVVSDITAPVESLSGQPIEINWTVKNQGAATAEGTWYDYVYLVNTATNSTQYVGIFEYSGSLAAGASLNRTQSYSVPLSLTGNYRVVVTTDFYGQVAEGTQNESNNTTTDDRPISLQLAPVPNLQVTGVTAPSTAFSSQETVVQWTVKNVGTGATNAPVWYDRVYLSLDTTYDNTDTYLGEAVNPSYLNPDDSYSNSLTVTLPRGIDGNYYFLVQTDVYNYVTEVGNEGDNWGSGGPTDVNLTPPPDLQVTAVNAPNGAFSGQPMNLSWTVTNAGTGRTLETAWYDRVFMSADATLDAGDRNLGTFYHSGALNAGANYTGSATVNLPIGVAGSFFFFVQSDIYNNVYEHVFENNNSGYDTTATNITLTPPPDLEFESLTIPSNARSGSSLSINYRVTNFGATETPNYYWTDTFYLSSDNQLNTATDINLGSVGQYGILYPGDGYDRTANFALPNTLTGTYYVFGVTDSGDQVFELDNVNNVTQSINQVQIVSQPADLVVTDAVIPTTGEAGKAISVQWTVKNQGTGDTIVNSWSDRLVVSNDEVLGDADDLTLASFTRTGLLAPNGTYSRTESVILPFTLEGNYQLFVVTDSANSVYEGSNEGNNASSAFPLTISRDTPDLQVTSITLPDTVTPGQPLTLNWTVANLGVGRTNSNYWYDQVYLSLDKNLSGDDINLGSVYRSGALEPSASYSATGTFSLPVNLNGSYYVLVQTDRDNNVIEGAFENNNVLASDSSSGGGSGTGSLPITPAPSADLAVTSVDAPEQGIAGQSLSLTWTVVNNDANTGQSWYDAVYLSRDQVFDRNSDIYLGYRNHTGGLNAGDSYTATQSFNIPRGLGGRLYAFVVTDGGNAVYERLGEINNVNYDGFSTEIILPPPVDLAVGTITIPVNGTPGQNATISYTVNNQSTNEAIGTWEDTIYLSRDNQWDVNDAFFGRVSQTGPVAGGGSYSKTVTATLPGVATGDYYVIVRSDIRNYIPESNEANNIKASLDDFAVDVESLELGTPDTGTLGQGQSVYYRVDVPAGETLLLSFDSQSTAAANELYIRYGDIPTRGQFDIGYTQPFSPDQDIVIPSTRGGTYYVLAYGDNVIGDAPSYSIRADVLEYSITDLGTNLGSNKGQATVRISGAKFTPNDVASLVGTDGTQRQASKIWWKNSTELWATFDLQGLSTGAYDVKVNNATQTAILDDGFTVTVGDEGSLETQLNLPSALRPGQAGIVTINYANAGETDIVSPLLVLSTLNANLQLSDGSSSDSYQFLAVGSEGPAGILSPGERGTLSLVFQPTVSTGEVNLNLRSLSAGEQPLDWSEIKDNSRPNFISDEAWEGIWNNFIASVGTTPQEYVAALADNANTFSQLGNSISNASQLIAAEIQQASSTLLGKNLTSILDASIPSPGLDLSFVRFFQSSFDGRLKLGALGYGWTHLWDITATADTEGTVTIQESGNIRLFERQADGSYIGQPGDNATLALVGNSYQLRESDGTILAFRVNGKLDYLEDPNQNRITVGYTNERLTSINHSNGDRLTLDYNSQGRISQLTDATGQVTTYTYNETGEHLLSVTNFQGTISYTYNNSIDVAQQNALQFITEIDGTVTGFNYDDRGRLAQTTLNGIPQISYSYDSNTGMTITNAEGKISKLLLNYLVQIGHSENPLGERIQYQYDRQGNVIQIIAPNGSLSNFTYDSRNNLIKSVDALGQTVEFIYESQFDNLTTIQDQRGNLLTYDYDNRGNLTAITYADGSQETFTLDSQGNTIVSVNRRNQTIQYTYNNQGLLTRKDYADGSSANYTYDSRGNLLSATDSDSSITYTYDTTDQLTRVTDGDGRLLNFSYDTEGRRSQMVDHNGFTTNYSYDNNGQLSRLSDGNDATIVTYTYDTVGRLIREDNGNETYTTYDYDDAGQLVSLVNYSGDGTINSSFEYNYDTMGRRTSMTTLDGTTTYGYDGIGQLTSVILSNGRTIEYRYDAAGNRISVQDSGVTNNYNTNNLNQYISVGSTTYSYDADGNLISKTENGLTSSFIYDVENRLISVTNSDGTWSYEYDALGNRIASIFDGERTEYLLDPAGLVDVVSEYDNSGNLLANYTYGLGLVGRVDGTNTAYYYDSDAIGSTVGLTGATGGYLNRYEYLPFGEDLTKVETVSNPFEYVGQWGVMDEGNGLDFMRERFYDPNQGRFLSTDNLGINGGLNLYHYVFNEPLTNIDIDGLAPTKIFKVLIRVGEKLVDSGKRLTKKQAEQAIERARKNGTDRDLFIEAPGRKDAKKLARDAGDGKKPIHDPPHPSAGPEARPHYHTNDRSGGHVLYSFTGPLTLPYWANEIDPDNEWLQTGAEILDFFNPLSLPQDLLDLWDWLNDQFVPIIRPSDPNDIVGPAGFGDEKWIASQTLPYTIRFENQASATAPAQTVYITHPLDSDVDFRTFRLGSFGWSGLTFNVPENRSFYNQRVDLTEEHGFLVDVFAGIDIQKGEAFWTLTTIDPETGETPENPLIGFLPPNNEDGVGDGFVTYSIRPSRTAETGDVIDAEATIIFDTEEPISTPPIFNTLDVDKPSSEVNDLPATTPTPEFLVSWTGTDTGSALATYTIYVSDNGGNYTVWLNNTELTEATYTGTAGHSYAFYSVAVDNAGNTEAVPTEADATIQIGGAVNQPPQISVNAGLTLNEGANSAISNSLLAATDADNTADQLTFTISTIPTNGNLQRNGVTLAVNNTFTQADINSGLLSYIHNGGETISDSFSFTVADGAGGNINVTSFVITVNPVDDAPTVLNPITDVNVNEDAANTVIDITNVFTDIDNDIVSIVKSVFLNDNTGLVTATIVDNQLTLDYQDNQSGIANITIRGTSNGKTVDDTFLVTVNPVDDAPTVLNPITDVSVDEDAANTVIDLTNVFTDIDNDIALIVKSVFVNNNPGLVTATIVDNQLTLDYQDNQSGIANLTIRGT